MSKSDHLSPSHHPTDATQRKTMSAAAPSIDPALKSRMQQRKRLDLHVYIPRERKVDPVIQVFLRNDEAALEQLEKMLARAIQTDFPVQETDFTNLFAQIKSTIPKYHDEMVYRQLRIAVGLINVPTFGTMISAQTDRLAFITYKAKCAAVLDAWNSGQRLYGYHRKKSTRAGASSKPKSTEEEVVTQRMESVYELVMQLKLAFTGW